MEASFDLPTTLVGKNIALAFKNVYTWTYSLNELIEEVTKHYPPKGDLVFSIVFVDKHANEETFIELDSEEKFMEMLTMYENEKENLGGYEVFRSSDTRAEVEYKGKRWEVILNERKCSCRVWQVTGLPCVHAAAFIAFTRDTDWTRYVDSCFTITKFKEAYALEVAPLPGKDQWVEREKSEKIYPPILKRPPGRPKKERIKPPGEGKKRHKCPRCGGYGHHEKKCKNPASHVPDSNQTSTSKRRRGKNAKARESCAI